MRVLAEDGAEHALFEVRRREGAQLFVRCPLLLEVGEEVRVRIVSDAETQTATATVIKHRGHGDEQETELLVSDVDVEKRVVAG